jgi:hypothetical protein
MSETSTTPRSVPTTSPNPSTPSCPRQLPHKLPQIPLRRILQVVFQRALVFLLIRPLHAHQQAAVPVQTHEAGDQKLVAQLVGLVAVGDVFDRVVQEQGVTGGPVDDAVEDVRYYFTLWGEG